MALDSVRFPTTLRPMSLRRYRPARRRGQIMPFLAVALFALALFATILIDASMMLQARRDIEVIALHAAKAGAQEFDPAAWASSCPPGASVATCSSRIRLRSTADDVAEDTALQWIAQNERDNSGSGAHNALTLAGRAPAGDDGVTASFVSVSGNPRAGVQVTITRCYDPFFINIFTGNQGMGCSNSTPISVTVTSRPIGGY